MKNLFEGPKNQNSILWKSANGFNNFYYLFVKKLQNEVSAYFYDIIY